MREVAPFCRCGEFVAGGVQRWRCAQKKAPEGSGAAKSGRKLEKTRGSVETPTPQGPKRGRSPLRSEMRAEAISARSIAASRRTKSGVLGANPIAAVLAMMVVPFLECGPVAASLSGNNLCIPDTRDNNLV